MCPYCGRPAPSTQLDHILPKANHPEYSVLAKNLIAVCADCNSAKSNDYLNDDGTRKFLNPYFDSFLNDSIWKLRFAGGDLMYPVFKIDPNNDIEEKQQYICSVHLNELKIIKYFSSYCRIHLRQCKSRYNKLSRNWNQFLDTYLKPEYEISCEFTGPNSWRSVFLAAVIDHPDIIQHCI